MLFRVMSDMGTGNAHSGPPRRFFRVAPIAAKLGIYDQIAYSECCQIGISVTARFSKEHAAQKSIGSFRSGQRSR
jgi:hypothetical protein